MKKNKILLFTEEVDITTNYVIDYLLCNNAHFVRFNDIYINNFKYLLNEQKIVLEKESICLKDKNQKIWYRRGRLNFNTNYVDDQINLQLNDYVGMENKAMGYHVFKVFEKRFKNRYLGRNSYYGENKLDILFEAHQLGLNIPITQVVTKRKDIIKFIKTHENVIIKGIYDNPTLIENGETRSLYTTKIYLDDMKYITSEFPPILIQNQIEKEYELRVFVFEGKIFTAALFSQGSSETEVDSRKYTWDNPIRIVPYLLPKKIEKRIVKLLSKLDYNSASIDFIVSKEGKYYFLEINPVGQFGWISYDCNFNIERYIANELTK